MFETSNQQTTISNFKPAKENHGDQKKLVGDIKVKMNVSNTVLDVLGNGLRAALYRKREKHEEPKQKELLPSITDGLTALKNPHFEPLSLDEKFPGYSAQFQSGLAVDDLVKLSEITLSGFVIEAKDGGTVELSFNMRCPIDRRIGGTLCALIQESVEMTLIAPKAEEQQRDLAA